MNDEKIIIILEDISNLLYGVLQNQEIMIKRNNNLKNTKCKLKNKTDAITCIKG